MSAYSDFLTSFVKNFGARVDEAGVVYPQAAQTLTKRVDIDTNVLGKQFQDRWYYIQHEDTFKRMTPRDDYIPINPLSENVIDSGPSDGLIFLNKLLEHDVHLRIWGLCGMLKKLFSASNKNISYSLIDMANDIRQGREGEKAPSVADIDNMLKLLPAFEKLQAVTGSASRHVRVRLIKRFTHEGRQRPGHAIISFPIWENVKEQLSKGGDTVTINGTSVPADAARIYTLLMESLFSILRVTDKVHISSEASDNFAPLGCAFLRAASYIESSLSKVTGENDHVGFAYTGDRKWMQSIKNGLEQWKALAGLLVSSRGNENQPEPTPAPAVNTARPAPHTQVQAPPPAPHTQPNTPVHLTQQPGPQESMAQQAAAGVYKVNQPGATHFTNPQVQQYPGHYTAPIQPHQLIPNQTVQAPVYSLQNLNGIPYLAANGQPIMPYNPQQHGHLLRQVAQQGQVVYHMPQATPAYTLTNIGGTVYATDAAGRMVQYNPQLHTNIVQSHVPAQQAVGGATIVNSPQGQMLVYPDGSIRTLAQPQVVPVAQPVNVGVGLGTNQVNQSSVSLGLGVPLG